MKQTYFVFLFLCLTTTFLLSQSPINVSQGDAKANARILDSYGKLPLAFEANQGQTDARVRFLSRTSGYTLFLTGDEAVLALRASQAAADADIHANIDASSYANIAGPGRAPKFGKAKFGKAKLGKATTDAVGVLRMKLRNANPAPKIAGADELTGTTNYFIGSDPAKWRTNIPTYAQVKYEGIYSGVDLIYYGNQRQLEYDFIVAPGADPRRIAFDVGGARRIRQDADGELVFSVGGDEIRWHKPVVYQEKDGKRQEIAARYAIADGNRVGFEVAKYDASKTLYIDPLIYSTYLDGSDCPAGCISSSSSSSSIAVDSAGNAYVTGTTNTTNFPTTPGAFQVTGGGAFLTKFNSTGSALVYSTYLGGASARGIAVDSAGNAYLTGGAGSDFPTTPGAFQRVCGGTCLGNAFITKVNSTGSALVYSTYLGGSSYDFGFGIGIDIAGNAYVTGGTCSTDFPTMNPVQPTYNYTGNCFDEGFYGDAFATKLSPTGSALVYSTYLGGSSFDEGSGIAADSAGNAYVTGYTGSDNFPVTPGAFQSTYGGSVYNAFLAKISRTGTTLVYSTYLSGSGSALGYSVAVDTAGSAYITGSAGSDFPTTPGAFQATGGGAFVTKFNATGSALVYSTYLGGTRGGYGIAVDGAGSAYITGNAWSKTFPTTPGAFQTQICNGCYAGWGSPFVTKFNSTGSALVYSTYLGGGGSGKGSGYQQGSGIAVDNAGNAYVTGWTASTKFPTTKGAFQPTCNDAYGCGVVATASSPPS